MAIKARVSTILELQSFKPLLKKKPILDIEAKVLDLQKDYRKNLVAFLQQLKKNKDNAAGSTLMVLAVQKCTTPKDKKAANVLAIIPPNRMERYKTVFNGLKNKKTNGIAMFQFEFTGELQGPKMVLEVSKLYGGKTRDLLKWMNMSEGKGQANVIFVAKKKEEQGNPAPQEPVMEKAGPEVEGQEAPKSQEAKIKAAIQKRMETFVERFKNYKELEKDYFRSVTVIPSFQQIFEEYEAKINKAHKMNVSIYMKTQQMLGKYKKELELDEYKAYMKKSMQLRERVRKEETKVKQIMTMMEHLKAFEERIMTLGQPGMALKPSELKKGKAMMEKVNKMCAKFMQLVPED